MKKYFNFFKKTIDKLNFRAYNITRNLNITKNDYDEEGRNVRFTESCRVVRDNNVASI